VHDSSHGGHFLPRRLNIIINKCGIHDTIRPNLRISNYKPISRFLWAGGRIWRRGAKSVKMHASPMGGEAHWSLWAIRGGNANRSTMAVTTTRGRPHRRIKFVRKRLAARAFLRLCTNTSSTSPFASTARQSQCFWPGLKSRPRPGAICRTVPDGRDGS